MKQKLSITVRGKRHGQNFDFDIDADPEYLQDWRDGGVEINEVYNSIPMWVPARLIRPWCFVQDLFYFRNPFKA